MADHELSQVHYRISLNVIQTPLVGVPEVKVHLRLLRTWKYLEVQVTRSGLGLGKFSWKVATCQEDDLRWAWMIGLAVERFDSWCKSLVKSDLQLPISSILPPVDVLMVWHAYLLNPSWLLEDSARLDHIQILRELSAIVFFPDNATELQKVVNSSSVNRARLEQWQSRSPLPFELAKSAKSWTKREIRCPICGTKLSVEYSDANSSGYLQDFKVTNHACEKPVTLTKPLLALRRLVEDITDVSVHLRGCLKPDMSVLSQTIKFHVMNASISKHPTLKPLISKSSPQEREEMIQAIMLDAEYDLEKLKRAMAKASGSRSLLDRKQPRLDRIMSAYPNEMDYSIDLIDAVLRQWSFLQKMRGLHWTYPGFFNNKADEEALYHAIARYHAFLDLMAASPGTLFVPTLDIDLVWHTHQLRPVKYEADMRQYVGRFINHDDKIETSQLFSAFRTTCLAWKERFNLPYHLCGCYLKEEKKLSHRLKRMVTVVPASDASTPPSHLPTTLSPLLLPLTHPSDYNSNIACSSTIRAPLEALRRKIDSRKTYEAYKQWQKAHPKPSRSRSPATSKAVTSNTYSHDPALLVPAPLCHPGSGGSSSGDNDRHGPGPDGDDYGGEGGDGDGGGDGGDGGGDGGGCCGGCGGGCGGGD